MCLGGNGDGGAEEVTRIMRERKIQGGKEENSAGGWSTPI
jgi:hypothetical protein